MDESKQKRKTPLTTVAISQECAFKMDEYLKNSSLTRKDFVELAVNYFTRTGFDIRSEAYDLTPLEKIADRLEKSIDTMQQHDSLKLLMKSLNDFNFVNKNLPAPKDIERRVEAEKNLEVCEKNNNYLKEQIKILETWKRAAVDEFNRISNEQKTFGKVKINIPKI